MTALDESDDNGRAGERASRDGDPDRRDVCFWMMQVASFITIVVIGVTEDIPGFVVTIPFLFLFVTVSVSDEVEANKRYGLLIHAWISGAAAIWHYAWSFLLTLAEPVGLFKYASFASIFITLFLPMVGVVILSDRLVGLKAKPRIKRLRAAFWVAQTSLRPVALAITLLPVALLVASVWVVVPQIDWPLKDPENHNRAYDLLPAIILLACATGSYFSGVVLTLRGLSRELLRRHGHPPSDQSPIAAPHT